MVEYITKERAKDLIVVAASGNSARLARMLGKLEDEPPADVVEVIRCKDCRYWDPYYNYCEEYATEKGEGDFCSFGKRKDGGDEE